MIDKKILKDKFANYFGEGKPRFFTAPGRINIIGEHTDYNGGYVVPWTRPSAWRSGPTVRSWST